MFRNTVKMVAARKVRLLTTSIAVVLGVAFMAGTLVLTDTLRRTFDDLYADANADTDVVVRGIAPFESEMIDQRPSIDERLVDQVAAVDGVQAAEAVIRGSAQLLDRDGKPLDGTSTAAPAGTNWLTNAALNPFTLAEGRAPTADHEVVIDRGSARRGDLRVGDTTTVLTAGGADRVVVVGIATFGSADSAAGASSVMFTSDAAQRMLGEPGRVDSISVTADGTTDAAALAQRIGAALHGVEVLTGAEVTADEQADAQDNLRFFTSFLMAFALIALFVGSFIIYNTFSILVAQRGKEIAMLRALGASRRQVMWSVITESALVGAIASAAGLASGIGVAALLKAMLAGFGVDLPAGGLVVRPNTVTTSLIAGIGVSVTAAILPARRAATVPPVAAMRDVAIDHSDRSRRRVFAGTTITLAGIALLVGGLFGGGGIAAVGSGVAAVFVGITALGPAIAAPVSRLLGSPLPRLRGVTGALARQNAVRNPKRTATTAAALMIGVALVAAMTVLASSVRASINEAINDQFAGDLVVESSSTTIDGLPVDLTRRLDELPETGLVAGVRGTFVQVDGEVEQIVAAHATTISEIIDFGDVEGDLALDEGSIAISEATADAGDIALGDSIMVTFGETGPQRFTVVATYSAVGFVGDYVLDLRAYEANVAERLDYKIFVTAADGVDLAQARAAVERITVDHPQAEVHDRAEFAETQTAHVDTMLNLVYALLALAIVIALFGIANTLALSVFERTREIGMLRAVGMSRPQVRASVRWEALIVALFGTLTGVLLGIGFGYAIVQAMADQGMTSFALPLRSLVVITAIAGFAGVAAAISPARRAARLDVLRAVAAT